MHFIDTLYKRALMFACADRFIYAMGIIYAMGMRREQVFDMLLMDKDERDEYVEIHRIFDD